MGVGLVISGLAIYGFLTTVGKTLGPASFAPLSAFWGLLFLVSPGVFFPLEQELARGVASRSSRGHGAGPMFALSAKVGTAAFLIFLALATIAYPLLVHQLFDGQWLLWLALVVALLGQLISHLARGLLAGNGQLAPLSTVLVLESVSRLALGAVLVLVGVRTAGPYGFAVALAPVLGLFFVRWRRQLRPGPPAAVKEFSFAFSHLVASSLLSNLLLNGGIVALKLMSPAGDPLVSRFLAGAVVTRVPLFLFQAVQIALLPKLAKMAVIGTSREFNLLIKHISVFLILAASIFVLTMAGVGSWAVGILFGKGFILGGPDMAYLAASNGAYMLAFTLSQGLIARSKHQIATSAWLLGCALFLGSLLIPGLVVHRVERSMLIGFLGAALAMWMLLRKTSQSTNTDMNIAPGQVPTVLEPL